MRQFTYAIADNRVYCMTQYRGKTIKGISKCCPEDTFNIELGKQLARARCEMKLRTAQVKALNRFVAATEEELRRVNEIYEFALTKRDCAIDDLREATRLVEDLEHVAG